jgi:2-polyprenyl-6-methoxyphenol hydroxylase-like FAD-dependent oxidoreductase
LAQVVVVGGGPTGLWLAAELALAGIGVTVVEKRPRRSSASRGFTVHPRTMEQWASRGIADRFLREGRTVPNSHYGLLPTRMDFGVLDTPFPFILMLAQRRVEELLEAYASDLGVDLRAGHEATKVIQRADAVSLRMTSPTGGYDMEADYVVGCDGVQSTVREAAGIDFPGTESTAVAWFADVRFAAPPQVPYYQTYGPNGGALAAPLGGGVYRIGGLNAHEDRTTMSETTYTTEELAAKFIDVAGEDFQLSEATWVSRSGSENRVAERYRNGRLFLAGDAAHRLFPAGGVGLNVGQQDAANLGWKLAAAVQGWAPAGLLDSYDEERRATGLIYAESSRAQVAVMTRFDPDTIALRSMLNNAISKIPQFSHSLAGQVSGLDTFYPPRSPREHPLVGSRAPNLRFVDGTDLFSLLTRARYVLIDLTDSGVFDSVSDGNSAPEPVVRSASLSESRATWQKVRAVVVRPDGHVAWASEKSDDVMLRAEATAALAATRRS